MIITQSFRLLPDVVKITEVAFSADNDVEIGLLDVEAKQK